MREKNQLSDAGSRIKRARLLAGIYSRKEFEEKYHISANTLQSWEQNKNKLTLKGALKLIEAFEMEGVLCTSEWLLSGRGVPPRTYESRKDIKNIHSNTPSILQEEEAVYKETQVFKENHPNSIIINVVDDALEPYFSVGDYIGGVKQFDEDIKKYLNEFCIVELENHLIIPRFLQAGSKVGTFTLACTNLKTSSQPPLNYYDTKILFAAPIIWHRKKFSNKN